MAKLLGFLIFYSISFLSQSQSTIRGDYCEETYIFSNDINFFEFYLDGFFEYRKESDFGEYRAIGVYKLTKDSLFLSFSKASPSKNAPHLILEPVFDTTIHYSILQVLDTNNLHHRYTFRHEIYYQDSMVRKGESDTNGLLTFDPELATHIKITYLRVNPTKRYPSSVITIPIEPPYLSYTYLAGDPITPFSYSGYTVGFKAKFSRQNKVLKIFHTTPDFFHPSEKRYTWYDLCD